MNAWWSSVRSASGVPLARVRSAPYLRKWLTLGVLIGIVAGLGAVVFYDGLRLATHLLLTDLGGYRPAQTAGEGGFRVAGRFTRPWAIPLVVGVGGLISGLLVFRFAPEAEGHGTDAAIKAVHTNPKGVRPRVIFVKLLASVITIGSGGSGGREGPTAQISSGFGSVLARVMNLTPSDSRICVASGIASGIGAIFRAPFGGALLGVELLYIDDVEIEALIPSLVATVVGYGIFCAITGNYSPVFGSHESLPTTHLLSLLLFVVVGLGAGVAGKLYTNCFYGLTDRFNRWNVPRAAKPAAAGLVVGLIGLAIPGVLGTGYGELQGQLILHQLVTMPWLIVLLLPLAKILATSLSIGSGGSGGIFGPGLVIGGATGALLWRVGHLLGVGPDEQIAFVIVAMAATFASIAHAPIAVLVMVAEMTGSLSLLPAAIVAVAFAMLVVGDTTIYRSQLRRRSDSLAHRFDFGLSRAALTVVDIMTPPRVVLRADLSPQAALAQLRQADVSGAPVVNGDGAYLGIVQSDALADQPGATRVGRLAEPEAITLPSEARLDAAVDALPASAGGWVPVLDDRMHVQGIISATELLDGCRRTMRSSWSEIVGAATNTVLLEGVVTEGSGAEGHAVSELGLPQGTIILSATSPSGALTFPDGSDELSAEDRVSVLVAPENVKLVTEMLGLTDASSTPHPHHPAPAGAPTTPQSGPVRESPETVA